jgi:hypothetical protein
MRTYGRVPAEPGGKPTVWVEVSTDANGLNDAVYLTSMIQVFKLNKNESPFFGNWGIDAKDSVLKQVFPDFDVWQIQRQFSPRFASLLIARTASPTPTYDVKVITNQGVPVQLQIAR